ncbi:hypothetical protein [Nonomuraea sediminis]|uniref:hypothetical protein n=1 Tax=Nonomuraea sediminis TaxID=2835864 RepID=UPI001BDD2868|nr:hypothetical protein [Nonomuraea sediminis]
MNEPAAAVLLLTFIAIVWVLLTALVRNARENTQDGKPLDTLTMVAVAGALLGVGLLMLTVMGVMKGIVEALQHAL